MKALGGDCAGDTFGTSSFKGQCEKELVAVQVKVDENRWKTY